MATTLEGRYTLRQVLAWTKLYFPSRFENLKRDRVKYVRIKTITFFEKDRNKAPLRKYIIESRSTPQYYPYYKGKDRRGRLTRSQRKVKHEYDTTIELGELSLDTTQWKIALGTLKKWDSTPPQSQIQSIYKKTRDKWKNQALKLHKGDKSKQKKYVEKKIKLTKKTGKYLDVGDFNAQINGINADFYFRFAMLYYKHGHLFGRYYGPKVMPDKTNPNGILAFPKHILAILEALGRQRIFK